MATGTNHGDPYYLVREEIQESVSKIQSGFEQWNKLPQSSDTRSTIAHSLVRVLPRRPSLAAARLACLTTHPGLLLRR